MEPAFSAAARLARAGLPREPRGSNGGTTYTTDVIRPLVPQPDSYGWRVRDSEGASRYREASVSYRSNYGTVQIGAAQDNSNSRDLLELRGSIATMDGGVFLSNWIDDGFAVIRTGAAGLEVLKNVYRGALERLVA